MLLTFSPNHPVQVVSARTQIVPRRSLCDQVLGIKTEKAFWRMTCAAKNSATSQTDPYGMT
jgi:hypothetical protein